jgi:ATP-dependent RNA helicase DHX57
MATSKVFVRDASVVTPYSMILFGGALTVHHREAKVSVGGRGWVKFRAEPRIGVLAKGLRAALSRLLADKIADPSLDVSAHPVIEAMLRLLVSNGM